MAVTKEQMISDMKIKDLYIPPEMHTGNLMLTPTIPHHKLKGNDLYHGVELELEGLSEGIPLPNHGGTPSIGTVMLSDGVLAHKDGSLRNGGIEFVTRPVRGAMLVSNIEQICSVASLLGLKASNRAGLHIHVDVQDLTPAQWQNLIKLYILLEPVFFTSAGPERKGSIYCKSLYQYPETKHIRETVQSIGTSYGWINMPSRYLGFNMNATVKYGTIEFRHKHSTTDTEEIIDWINLIDQWYKYGVENEITTEFANSISPEGLVQKVFGTLSVMDAEYPSYFYHGCLPLWFDVFGPEQSKQSLQWTRKKPNPHKGYKKFMEKIPAVPKTKPKQYVTASDVDDNWSATPTFQFPPITTTQVPKYFNESMEKWVYYAPPKWRPEYAKRASSPALRNIAGRDWQWMGDTHVPGSPANRVDLYGALSTPQEQSNGAGTVVYIYAR